MSSDTTTRFDLQMHLDDAGCSRLPDQRTITQPPISVSEPMSVLWQGVEYPVTHWDVHGFSLETPIPRALAPGRGRVVDVALLIGQGETRIQMHVQARAAADDPGALRYQFIDLGRAQAELLHRIVDYAVTKQELSLTQLLNDSRETRAAHQETNQRMLSFRTWFQASLACVALGAAGLWAFSSFANVTSRYAAVSGAAVSVATPAAGKISAVAVAPGAHVAQGDVLGFLRTPDHDRRTEELSDRLRQLEAEQAELRARRQALAQLDTHAEHVADSEYARLQDAVRRAESRLVLETQQLATLRATGLPTLERQQARIRQEGIKLAAESDLAQARAALESFESARAHGLSAASAAATTGAGMTLDMIDLRLSHLSAEIARAYARDEEHGQGVPILSPCACEVAQVTRVSGEWAEPSQPLFVLARSDARSVHALVMADAAGRITTGDRAEIRLANGQSLRARVTHLSYDTQRAGMAGLKTDVFAAERFARVELEPDQPLDLPIGLTGTVTIRTLDPVGWLRDRIGV